MLPQSRSPQSSTSREARRCGRRYEDFLISILVINNNASQYSQFLVLTALDLQREKQELVFFPDSTIEKDRRSRLTLVVAMDDPVEIVYQAPSGFEEDNRDPLIDLDLSDSKELWLIQWPINQPSDFDGKQVSLKLDDDGHLGSFEGSSGKSYDMFSLKSQGPEAIVFLSSASGGKIAGKISRSVSLVHYPEPSEYQKRNNLNLSYSQRSSAATSTMSGRRTVSNHSSRGKNSQAVSGYSTPSSRNKSSVSGHGDPCKPQKRRLVPEQSGSINRSDQDSGKGNSAVTSTGSLEHSDERKSKKKKTSS